jgi:hypothetical protein
MFVPHRKHTCGPPRSVTRIALVFSVEVLFVIKVEGRGIEGCGMYRDLTEKFVIFIC